MAELKNNALEAAKKIKLMAFDVDGVMTDGSVTYDENGVEYKTFNVKDGHGLVRMGRSGFITAIITARNNGKKIKKETHRSDIADVYRHHRLDHAQLRFALYLVGREGEGGRYLT